MTEFCEIEPQSDARAVIREQYAKIRELEASIDQSVAHLTAEWAAEHYPTAVTAAYQASDGPGAPLICELRDADGIVVAGRYPLNDTFIGLLQIGFAFTNAAIANLSMTFNRSTSMYELDPTKHRTAVPA